MSQYFLDSDPFDGIEDELHIESDEFDENESGPSLPIILFSAAMGLGFGILGLYVAYIPLQLSVEVSAGLSTLILLFAMGGSATVLSVVTESNTLPSNIGFSCGLIVLVLLFFGLCGLIGAIAATLIVTWGI